MLQAVGVCASDLHYYHFGRIGNFVVEKPLILGHEAAGIIKEVGKGVRKFKPGDKVTLEPGVTCRHCLYCKQGRYNLCSDVRFMATPPIDGAFVEYVVHPQDFTYHLPEKVSLEEGALIEPLSVGMHACRLCDVQPGNSVAILGVGPIGLLALQAAAAYGATKIIAIDKNDFRLDLAKKVGASDAINITGKNFLSSIMELTENEGVDVILECSGAVEAVKNSVSLVKRGGTMCLIGMGHQDIIPLNVIDIISREVKVQGIFRYANTYPKAISLIEKGKISLKPLISKEFPLEHTKEALEYSKKTGSSIKVLIRI